MPELPEVETIKETLKQLVVGKQIKETEVYWPNIIKEPDDKEEFKQLLENQTIHHLTRRGKFILFHLDRYVLVSHLRMEGKYMVVPEQEPVQKHTHVVFRFTNGEELRYKDVRKFGTMHLFPKGKEMLHKPLVQLGADPFDEGFTFTYLYQKLNKTDRFIKTVLLDQTVVAGIGNIYADEILFQAEVHPLRRASKLTKEEIKRIQSAVISILSEAVKLGGTTIRSYVNSQGDMGMFQQQLFVYGQEGEPCKKCGTPIVKGKVSGRGTHICKHCQK